MSVRTWRQRLDELPSTLAVALRLHDGGHPDAVVATALDVPVEGVPALLQVARAKLHHLTQEEPVDGAVPDRNQWSTTEG